MASASGESASLGHVPSIQVFYPDYELFKDFPKLIDFVEASGAQHSGICKVCTPTAHGSL